MESESSPVKRLADFFDQLSPGAIASLPTVYDSKIIFQDPVNRAEGLPQLETVFKDLFKQLQNVRMTIRSTQGNNAHGFILWTMDYEFRGNRRSIDGVTYAEFSATGQTKEQKDYWDSAFPIYGEFPLVGLAMKGIRRIVSVKHKGTQHA